MYYISSELPVRGSPDSFRYISHHGILGQKWGIRRYQNKDGTLTAAGKKRLNPYSESASKQFHSREKKVGEGTVSVEKGKKVDLGRPIGGGDKAGNRSTSRGSHHSGHFEKWTFQGASAELNNRYPNLHYGDNDPYTDLELAWLWYEEVFDEELEEIYKREGLDTIYNDIEVFRDMLEDPETSPVARENCKETIELLTSKYSAIVQNAYAELHNNKRVAEASMLVDHSVARVTSTPGWENALSEKLNDINNNNSSANNSVVSEIISNNKDKDTEFFVWDPAWGQSRQK